MSFNIYSESVRKFLETNLRNDINLQRWYTRLSDKAPGTVNVYIPAFKMFCERFKYNVNTLYEARLLEATSDKPRSRGVIRDQVVKMMREMEDGNYEEWPDSAKALTREGLRGQPLKRKSPSTCHQIAKALTSFFETFEEQMELHIKVKEMPQGDSTGPQGIKIGQVREVVKHSGRENPYRNVAIAMFLKDSGLRRGDLQTYIIGDYLEAKKTIQNNEFGEPFISFNPERTKKEGIIAHVHLGPEAIRAIDKYLEVERPDAKNESPLFSASRKHGVYPLESRAVGQVIERMIKKALGHEAKRKSALSFRKLHKTGLEAGGMSEFWIRLLQGIPRNIYSRREGLDGSDRIKKLMVKYMEAYDQIRVYQNRSERERDLFRNLARESG